MIKIENRMVRREIKKVEKHVILLDVSTPDHPCRAQEHL
jgi:CTP:molybdopterin cytidylyltransferase MocA